MRCTSNRIGAASIYLAALFAFTASNAGTAAAELPRMTSETPTLIGGHTIGSGHQSIGASGGFPVLRGEFFFGLGNNVDVGLMPGLTFGGWMSGGLNQGIGTHFEAPFRFNLMSGGRAALALRLSPYARIGRGFPSWGTGATIGLRASIPLRKLFSIVVGGETRGGFGSFHDSNCAFTGFSCRDTYFEGATYAVIGLETLFRDRWFFFAEYDVGATYTSGGGYYRWTNTCVDQFGNLYPCGGAATGLFNAHLGFGYLIR